MRRSTTSELRMLRMMMWHFGIDTRCCFCHKPLLDEQVLRNGDGRLHFGGQTLPPIKTKLTIHHADDNHHNNEKRNRKPCHRTCHRSFHMKQRRKNLAPQEIE